MLHILKDFTILYVEDEPKIQALIARYLRHFFKTVYVATTGVEALELYEVHHPHVLLLDIELPLLNGLDLAYKIRDKNKSIKIIMLSAYADQKKLLFATELKLTKYLIKPLDPKYFKEVLHLLVEELVEDTPQFMHIASHCIWDNVHETLMFHSETVVFTQKEQQLFKLLLKRKGTSVSYEDIMIAVWEDAFDKEISIDAVKILVSRIRKKLPKECITSVYGKGYTLL